MPLPQMHGRTHIPAGYAAVVQASDGTDHIAQASSDQIPCVTSTSSSSTQLVLVRGSASYPITVNSATWTDIGAVNWSNVYEQGDGNHVHVNTVPNPDRIQIYHDAVFTFSGCIEWGASFTATRRIRIGPSGTITPEGSGLNEIDMGEEGNNNTFGTTFMANFGAGSDPQVLTLEVWQDSGSSQTVTGDTSFLLVLLGLIG